MPLAKSLSLFRNPLLEQLFFHSLHSARENVVQHHHNILPHLFAIDTSKVGKAFQFRETLLKGEYHLKEIGRDTEFHTVYIGEGIHISAVLLVLMIENVTTVHIHRHYSLFVNGEHKIDESIEYFLPLFGRRRLLVHVFEQAVRYISRYKDQGLLQS